LNKYARQENTKEDRERMQRTQRQRTQRKEKLRKKLIGSESKKEQLQEKIDAAEELLVINENEYAERRRDYPPLNTVWYSRNTLIITIAVFAVTFLAAEYISKLVTNHGTIFFSNLELSMPTALGTTLIPIIISIAKNNVRLQKKNAEINLIYSEIANLRNKITLLRQELITK
jgi:hypothetical protein